MPPSPWPHGRPARHPELARRVKQSIIHMGQVTTHEQAVTDELAVQWWSMAQPEFAERRQALQRKISSNCSHGAVVA